jgi:hypothetical protein
MGGLAMTEEARRLIDVLRQIDENDCEYEARGVVIDLNKAADLIESLSAQLEQVTRERDAETELIGKLIVILKKYPNAATNGCAYEAYREIKKWLLDMRGVEVE